MTHQINREKTIDIFLNQKPCKEEKEKVVLKGLKEVNLEFGTH